MLEQLGVAHSKLHLRDVFIPFSSVFVHFGAVWH
jgi:hypothetical protein